jgi:broad specificity phosphatase PhoE
VGNALADSAQTAGLEHIDLPTRDADLPLTELGTEQARTFGRWLRAQPVESRPTYVVSSPYVRASETARLVVETVGGGLASRAVERDERLRDREMGVAEQLTWAGIEARLPAEAERARRLGPYYWRPSGGESWTDVCQRLRAVLTGLAADLTGERVLVVAHDVVIQLARALVDGLDEAATVALVGAGPYANCALTAYEADGDRYRLTAWNQVPTPPRS